MSIKEISGGPLSRIGRNEAAIISYLRVNATPVQQASNTEASQQELSPEEAQKRKTALLRRFRGTPDVVNGPSEDSLYDVDNIPRWARD